MQHWTNVWIGNKNNLLLQACQEVVLKKDGQRGGDLAGAWKHFSWSPIRCTSVVESFIAITMTIIACLLFFIEESEDTNRINEDRDKSSATLATCGFQNFLTIGLHTHVMYSLEVFLGFCQTEDFDPTLVC